MKKIIFALCFIFALGINCFCETLYYVCKQIKPKTYEVEAIFKSKELAKKYVGKNKSYKIVEMGGVMNTPPIK